jgi:hypothetical protein
MDEASDLDDGLIRRVIRACNGRVAYGNPVVAHQGFRAYNRYMNYMNEGTIQEMIDNFKRMQDTIKSTDRYTRDFEPYMGA